MTVAPAKTTRNGEKRALGRLINRIEADVLAQISIAMASYNGERFLLDQLKSLAAQTLRPFELIVCDDGSSDETLAILDRFAATAAFPVQIHRNDHRLGYRANFMKAAALCSGELIAFCDQDDVWDEDKLAIVSKCFAHRAVNFVFHDYRLIDRKGDTIEFPSPRSNIATVDDFTIIPGLTQVFRHDLLSFHSLWPLSIDPQKPAERLAHDQWFLFIAHSLSSTHYCDHQLLGYRQHDDNTYGIKSAITRTSDLSESIVKSPSRWQALESRLLHKRRLVLSAFDGREAASLNRVMLLEKMKRIGGVALQTSVIDRHMTNYIALSSVLRRRRGIYSARTTSQRLACLAVALKSRAYGMSLRGCRDLLLDLVLSNVIPRDNLDHSRTIHGHVQGEDV